MKKMIIFSICILFVSYAHGSSGSKSNVSWSLLYGKGENKNTLNYRPEGGIYKTILSINTPRTEVGFVIRYADFSDGITYNGQNGNIKYTNLTAGMQFGLWVFSRFKLHVGYARHKIDQEVLGSFTTAQKNIIDTTYKIKSLTPGGVYGGADLIFFGGKTVQLFGNYNYYRLNSLDSHEWEAMVGIRINSSSSGSGSNENFFTKMFNSIFTPGAK